MKRKTIISLVVATGMAAPALTLASDFGGGWMHDKHTGTLSWTQAPDAVRHQGDAENTVQTPSGFGGGLVRNKDTGTVYSIHAPKVNQQADSHGQEAGRPTGFGGGWAKDKSSNTLSYRPEEVPQTAYD